MSPARDTDQSPDAPSPQTDSSTDKQTVATGRRRKALTVLFFGLLVAHVAGNIDPQVLYQGDEVLTADKTIPVFPAYLRGRDFLAPFLAVSGGLTDYVGANVSQYFSIPYGGAAVLAAVALVAFLATGSIMSLAGDKAESLLRFVPPILLVIIWNRYTFVLADQLALLAALLVVCLYFRLPNRARLRAAVALPAILVFYYLAGGLCMLAAAMCGLYELLAKRRKVGWAYLVVGAITPLVVGSLLGDTFAQPYLRLTGLSGGLVATAAWMGLYGFFLVLMAALAIGSRLGSAEEKAGQARATGGFVAMLVAAIVLSLVTLDRDVRTFRRLCYFNQAQRWREVILQARKLVMESPGELYSGSTCRMLNRALFERRRLGVRMFAYPQARLGGLLLGRAMDEPYKSDSLLQLGAVDLAESLARESQDRWPDRPFVLRLLVKIALVKGDMAAARGHLETLSKDIIHGQFAKELLAKIDGGYDFARDEQIARIRSFMITARPPGPMSLRGMLEKLADKNPDNRMALEYLLAYDLLNRQLEPFVARVKQIGRFDYRYLPPHYAEAILLRAARTNQRPNFDGLPEKDPSILISGPMFVRLYEQHKADLPALQAALARELRGSYYWYYFTAMLQESKLAEQSSDR
ncbi:hypothetical protein LCGC14_0781220 [marine sediment metagenome]|uniref:Uncharacterized protein n=1 Tax=marine sediment metagenome TaxID=412755 RepID=A0A0F9T2H8_9ZZZZ|nr:hypothetical protein [Phycisphaerae bacterium]HDZ43082.1 hypothetical protein [Phycisphaerae bacterium]